MNGTFDATGAQTKSPIIHTPKVTWITPASFSQSQIAGIHAKWNKNRGLHRKIVAENTLRIAGKSHL